MQKKAVDSAVYAFALIFLSFVFLYLPELVTDSVTSSLSLCAARVIPAVFPFSVLSSFFFYSGTADAVDRIMSRPFYRLFGLRRGASAFLSGLVFGFPIAAMTAGKLFSSGRITKSECERLTAFSCCASPSFPVFAVGVGMYRRLSAGLLLWGVQAVFSVLIGFILHIFRPLKSTEEHEQKIPERVPQRLSDMLTSSVSDASRVMLSVAGSVTFFSLLGSVSRYVTDTLIGGGAVSLFISAFFEFNSACSAASEAFINGTANFQLSLSVSAFAVAFSGLSVICQSASVLPSPDISVRPLIIGKLFCGTLSAVSVYFIAPLICKSASVSVTDIPTNEKNALALPFAAVFTLLIIYTFKKCKRRTCKREEKVI